MKILHTVRLLKLRRFLLFQCLFILSSFAIAQEESMISAHFISSIENIEKIEVIVVPSDLLFRSQLTEEIARSQGCIFSTFDKSSIQHLVFKLKSEGIYDRSPLGDPINLRTIIYLKSKSGKISILMEEPGEHGNVTGQIISKFSFINQFFTANQSVLKNLHLWIQSETAVVWAGNASCNRYKVGNFL